jgi:hypothetical protein
MVVACQRLREHPIIVAEIIALVFGHPLFGEALTITGARNSGLCGTRTYIAVHTVRYKTVA